MEKMYIKESINFTEENLMRILEDLLSYENIETFGDEYYKWLNKAENYMNEHDLSKDDQFAFSNYFSSMASASSTYAYKKGFTEGVRLFRTLLQL